MKKYNNIANQMNFVIISTNILYPALIAYFYSREQSIDTIVPMIMFVLLLIVVNFFYFFLLDQWYYTYYNESSVIQKWFKKRKQINFADVRFLYFVGSLVILSSQAYDLPTSQINYKKKRKIVRMLKNEIVIIINVYDKHFPKILLSKCINATKVDFEVKAKIYREMFELD